ncbi:hypothetical protein WMF38_25725 [Sorangium sp. So ce118]
MVYDTGKNVLAKDAIADDEFLRRRPGDKGSGVPGKAMRNTPKL